MKGNKKEGKGKKGFTLFCEEEWTVIGGVERDRGGWEGR